MTDCGAWLFHTFSDTTRHGWILSRISFKRGSSLASPWQTLVPPARSFWVPKVGCFNIQRNRIYMNIRHTRSLQWQYMIHLYCTLQYINCIVYTLTTGFLPKWSSSWGSGWAHWRPWIDCLSSNIFQPHFWWVRNFEWAELGQPISCHAFEAGLVAPQAEKDLLRAVEDFPWWEHVPDITWPPWWKVHHACDRNTLWPCRTGDLVVRGTCCMLLLHVVACRFKVRCCTLSGRIQLFPCHVIVFGCQQVISTKECKSRCPACVLEACLVKAKPNMAKKYKDASLISCFPCIVTVGEMLLSATELGAAVWADPTWVVW